MHQQLFESLPDIFSKSIHSGSWEAPPGDVPELFRGAVEHLDRFLAEAVEARDPRAVTILGEAGSGKTHLLTSYRRTMLSKPDRFLIGLQLETSLARFWRYVREKFVTELLKPISVSSGETNGLERILERRFPTWAKLKSSEPFVLDWLFKKRLADSLAEHLKEFASHCPDLDANMRRVLPQLWGTKKAIACDWLKGARLPPADLESLGLYDEKDEEDAEAEARGVVLSTLHLAGHIGSYGQPTALVVAFDQVEGMSDGKDATVAVLGIAKAVNTMLGIPGPKLIATFLRKSYSLQARVDLEESFRHRILQNAAQLDPIPFEHVVKLLCERIAANRSWNEAKRNDGGDAYWPFGEKALRALVEVEGHVLTPRHFLRQGGAWFQELRAGKTLTIPTSSIIIKPDPLEERETDPEKVDVIDRLWKRQCNRFCKPGAVKFDDTFVRGLPWLLETLGLSFVKLEVTKALAFLDLLFTEHDGSRHLLGIAVCHEVHTSLPARLRRLRAGWDAARASQTLTALVVLLPTSTSIGRVGQQHLDELASTGARVLRLELPTVAEFAAYQAIFTEAMNGNLTYAGKPVDADVYSEWARGHFTPLVKQLAADAFALASSLTK